MFVGRGREGGREGGGEIAHTHTHTHTRERECVRGRELERGKQRNREKKIQRESERDKQREREKHSHTHTHTHSKTPNGLTQPTPSTTHPLAPPHAPHDTSSRSLSRPPSHPQANNAQLQRLADSAREATGRRGAGGGMGGGEIPKDKGLRAMAFQFATQHLNSNPPPPAPGGDADGGRACWTQGGRGCWGGANLREGESDFVEEMC